MPTANIVVNFANEIIPYATHEDLQHLGRGGLRVAAGVYACRANQILLPARGVDRVGGSIAYPQQPYPLFARGGVFQGATQVLQSTGAPRRSRLCRRTTRHVGRGLKP